MTAHAAMPAADAAAQAFRGLLRRNLAGEALGVTALCTAHPLALRAGMALARDRGQLALVEATCNQVNQEGGYTGLTPEGFAREARRLAAGEGLAPDRLLLGGDHLGPQPWRALGAPEAMARAERLVADYARAGFLKIHLDCSMACAGDPDPLPEREVAARAARLALAAEATGARPAYVVGTEVPAPGGMGEGHAILPTPPEAVRATWAAHEAAFRAAGAEAALGRAVALVVQPGLDFGNEEVVPYDPAAAAALSRAAADLPGLVFEAHSTDYQRPEAYRALVRGRFAILKVGPAATFALREALFALEMVAAEMGRPPAGLRSALEAAMLAEPRHWRGHYAGDEATLRRLRAFSYSDRLRYYWTEPTVAAAAARLLDGLAGPLPPTLLSQFLPGLRGDGAEALVLAAVRRALDPYADACGAHPWPR